MNAPPPPPPKGRMQCCPSPLRIANGARCRVFRTRTKAWGLLWKGASSPWPWLLQWLCPHTMVSTSSIIFFCFGYHFAHWLFKRNINLSKLHFLHLNEMTATIHHPRCDFSTHNGVNVRCVGEQRMEKVSLSPMLSVMQRWAKRRMSDHVFALLLLVDILIKQYMPTRRLSDQWACRRCSAVQFNISAELSFYMRLVCSNAQIIGRIEEEELLYYYLITNYFFT